MVLPGSIQVYWSWSPVLLWFVGVIDLEQYGNELSQENFISFEAENPKHSINVDFNVPYDVRLRGPGSGRYSTPVAADMPVSPTFRSSDTNGAVMHVQRTAKSKFTYSRYVSFMV